MRRLQGMSRKEITAPSKTARGGFKMLGGNRECTHPINLLKKRLVERLRQCRIIQTHIPVTCCTRDKWVVDTRSLVREISHPFTYYIDSLGLSSCAYKDHHEMAWPPCGIRQAVLSAHGV